MRKRTKITITMMLLGIGVIVWEVLREREPVYQGKRLSTWLTSHNSIALSGDSVDAVRHMGTNAIPTLLKMLRSKCLLSGRPELAYCLRLQCLTGLDHSGWTQPHRAAAAFEILGPQAAGAVPQLVAIWRAVPLRNHGKLLRRRLARLAPKQGTQSLPSSAS